MYNSKSIIIFNLISKVNLKIESKNRVFNKIFENIEDFFVFHNIEY